MQQNKECIIIDTRYITLNQWTCLTSYPEVFKDKHTCPKEQLRNKTSILVYIFVNFVL